MLRAPSALSKLAGVVRATVSSVQMREKHSDWKPVPLNDNPFISHHAALAEETAEEFDKRFLDYFNREDLDGWMLRKGMSQLHRYDVIPEPEIIVAALKACRRVNDYSLTTRFLESIKMKCGPAHYRDIVYPWIIEQIQPTLDELGISTPEEMGYDVPELWHPDPSWFYHETYKEYGLDKNPKFNTTGN